jgi:predicted transcriptional regulator of viral defense system
MVKNIQSQEEIARSVLIKSGGIARTKDILSKGVYPRTLYALRDHGVIEPLARGLYHLPEVPLPPHYELVIISILLPKAVFCLISALDFHEITTQIPHAVYIALPKGTKTPKIEHPRIRVFKYSLDSGVEVHNLNGFKIRIFSPEKTVVDCFKFRNKIGKDVAIESLRLCMEKKHSKPMQFLKYARIAKVKNIISPYLEALYE